MKKFTNLNKKGFTLIEMMLVVGVITILSGAIVLGISTDYSRFKESMVPYGGQFEPEAWEVVNGAIPNSVELVRSSEDTTPSTEATEETRHDNGNHNGWNNPNNPHYNGGETTTTTTTAPTTQATTTTTTTQATTTTTTTAPAETTSQASNDVNSDEYFANNLAGTSHTSSLNWHNDNGRHNGFGNSNHNGYSGTNIRNLQSPVTNYYYWGAPVVETRITIPDGITCSEYEIVIEYNGDITRVNSCWNADYEIDGNRIRLTTSNQAPGEIGIQVYVSGGEADVVSVVAVGYNTNNGNGHGNGNGNGHGNGNGRR